MKASIKKHAKKILIPHQENQYRPHLIRASGLTAVLALALLAQLAYGFVTTGHLSVLGRVSNVLPVELLESTNAERARQGLPPLAANEALNQAALLKAHDMFTNNYWEHTSPSGVEPWKWLGDVGYAYRYAGENLAKNYPTAATTVKAWMGSAAHRENVMNEHYADVGFAVLDGVLDGQDTTLVVALYGAPAVLEPDAPDRAVQGERFVAPVSTTGAGGGVHPLSFFGQAALSVSPVTAGLLAVLALVAAVGAVAHHYRAQLPKAWRQNWRRNHGMYTFWGMIGLGVMIILGTGGGSL